MIWRKSGTSLLIGLLVGVVAFSGVTEANAAAPIASIVNIENLKLICESNKICASVDDFELLDNGSQVLYLAKSSAAIKGKAVQSQIRVMSLSSGKLAPALLAGNDAISSKNLASGSNLGGSKVTGFASSEVSKVIALTIRNSSSITAPVAKTQLANSAAEAAPCAVEYFYDPATHATTNINELLSDQVGLDGCFDVKSAVWIPKTTWLMVVLSANNGANRYFEIHSATGTVMEIQQGYSSYSSDGICAVPYQEPTPSSSVAAASVRAGRQASAVTPDGGLVAKQTDVIPLNGCDHIIFVRSMWSAGNLVRAGIYLGDLSGNEVLLRASSSPISSLRITEDGSTITWLEGGSWAFRASLKLNR